MRDAPRDGAAPTGAALPDKPPGVAVQAARELGAALVVALAALSFYVSSAGLLFQGPLAPHLPAAIGATLLGGAVLSLAAAWRGTLPLASAGAVPATVPVLSALTAGIAGTVPADAALPTAVAALALAAAAMGGAWWWMGRRGWGGLIRYIPYPVIGGFMGATGWLLATGGLGVATGQRFSGSTLAAWAGGAADARLATGLGIGVLLWLAGRRFKHVLVLPALLLAGALAIHGGLHAAGLDAAAARAQGWLQTPFQQALPIAVLQPAVWSATHWEALLPQLGWVVSCVIIGTLSLLLTTSSLEVAWDTRSDINRDLRALGQGNLLAAASGGLAGGISLSRSVLNRSAGAQGRASGVLLAVLCLLALLWGGPVIALVPLPLLGGLLLAQGLDMLKTWLLDSRHRLTRRDHLTVLAIVAITAVMGFLPAVCLGVLACCADFAATQAGYPPVRRLLNRAGWLGSVERPHAQAEWLMQRGAGLQIVELQGALFFGSATRVSQQVEALMQGPAMPRQLLFDFQHVRTLDSTAAQALASLFKRLKRLGAAVALSGLHAAHERPLRVAGALDLADAQRHPSIDAAVAAWDEAQLAAALGEAPPPEGLDAALAQQLGPELAGRLRAAFRPVSLKAGAALFERGDAADALYLVASGRLAAVVPAGEPDEAPPNAVDERAAPMATHEATVRTLLPGSTVGEMGLFLRQPRSATVRALEDSTLLALDAARLARLEAEDPPAAAALQRLLLQQMASRLDQLTVQAHLLARQPPPR